MKFAKLEEGLNTVPFLEEVYADPDYWKINVGRQHEIECQRHTETINLVKGYVDPEIGKLSDSNIVHAMPVFENFPMVKQFLGWFKNKYGGNIARVAIVKLHDGKNVDYHIDAGEYYKDKDRFHLVLCGNYDYYVDGVMHHFKQGDLWWFDNKQTHAAENRSGVDRITIIFDVHGSNWREMVDSDNIFD